MDKCKIVMWSKLENLCLTNVSLRNPVQCTIDTKMLAVYSFEDADFNKMSRTGLSFNLDEI